MIAKLWRLTLCLLVHDVAVFEYVEYKTVDQFFKLETYFSHVHEDFVWTSFNVVHDLTFYFGRGVFVIDDV